MPDRLVTNRFVTGLTSISCKKHRTQIHRLLQAKCMDFTIRTNKLDAEQQWCALLPS